MNVEANGILDFEVFPLKENLMAEGAGNNRKGLFVACAGKSNPDSSELLSKMLQAAGHDLFDDAFVIWLETPQLFCFSSLRNEAGFSKALFFGIPPKQAGLNLNAQPNQPLEIAGVTYLFTANLAEIQANPALKRPLWEGMKAMFKV